MSLTAASYPARAPPRQALLSTSASSFYTCLISASTSSTTCRNKPLRASKSVERRGGGLRLPTCTQKRQSARLLAIYFPTCIKLQDVSRRCPSALPVGKALKAVYSRNAADPPTAAARLRRVGGGRAPCGVPPNLPGWWQRRRPPSPLPRRAEYLRPALYGRGGQLPHPETTRRHRARRSPRPSRSAKASAFGN